MGAAGVPGVLSGATILGGEGSTSPISSYSCCVAMAAVSASGIAARGICILLGQFLEVGEKQLVNGLRVCPNTNFCASVEPSLQQSTIVTPVMITATRNVAPNAIPKPENKRH